MKILMLVTMFAFVMAGLPTHAEGRDCDNCVGCFIRGNCHKYTPTSNGPRNAKDCQKAGGTDCKDGYVRPITNSNEMPSTTSAFTYPYDVTVSRRVNEGFGFVIFENHASRTGPTIGRIIAGSPAERCGRLHLGDRILAVNHVDIAGMRRGDIENLIEDFGYSVVLTVGGPIEDRMNWASAVQKECFSNEMRQEIRQLFILVEDIYLDRGLVRKFDDGFRKFWQHNPKVRGSKYTYYDIFWKKRGKGERYFEGLPNGNQWG